jgi:hypothetical protein
MYTPHAGGRWGRSSFARWLWSIMSHEKQDPEVQHLDFSSSSSSDPLRSQGRAINALLVFACAVFGAASFLFGYDDKLISPVAALAPFVSISPSLAQCKH